MGVRLPGGNHDALEFRRRRRGDEGARPNAKPLAEFVSGFPISDASKAQIIALYAGGCDPLAGKSLDEKRAILKRTS